MPSVHITINGSSYQADAGDTILSAAAANGIYIPSLCHHPDLPPFCDLPLAARVFHGETVYENQPVGEEQRRRMQGCGLCAVEVAGLPDPVWACETPVAAGMSIQTAGAAVVERRRADLMKIMARHPHACLTCAQREGCSLESCSANVPREERCCSKFHDCELRKVAEYVGIKEETPRYRPAGLATLRDEPLFVRDFNLCIDCGRCVGVCDRVRGVGALGVVHHAGRLVVGSVAPTLLASACKFCGACVEVCPTGCLLDRDAPAGAREPWLVPCVHTCPAGVDVPGYIRRISVGEFAGAAALIWETLPLPNVLGHICFHLCECECRRAQLDDPLAICALKRFALENADGAFLAQTVRIPASGKQVAVVGSGPAGLAAAYFLRFKGHRVTVFEAEPLPGGAPALSIPGYRLPPAVLEKDLAVIRKLGVEIKTGCRLSGSAAMTDLLGQGFDAVLLAVGLPEPKKITIEGSELAGVFWGLEFLRRVKSGATFNLGREIVVVGGGNVALDVAMTALRLSGGMVRLFCLESREEMPAHKYEIERAEAEGIQINPGWGPAVLRGAAGKLSGVEFRRCLTVFDERRSFAPTFDERQRMTVAADAVFLAIGQVGAEGLPAEQDGVFRAGDVTGGPMSVVHAVASGRAAAAQMDRYLGGDGQIVVALADRTPPPAWIGRQEGFALQRRVAFPCTAPDARRVDFRELEGTYSAQEAIAEARRCLQCDLRLLLARPARPPESWLEFCRANVEPIPAVEGTFVLADATKKPTLIKGTANVRLGLLEQLAAGTAARFFRWEDERMYTKRESELIQQHVQRYGELPGGGDHELDDLF